MNGRATLFIAAFIISSQVLSAQGLHLGATASLCGSRISNNVVSTSEFKVRNALSFDVGLFAEKTLNTRSSLGVEALWVQINGREGRKNVPLFGYQNFELVQLGTLTDMLRIRSAYFAMPAYYRLKWGAFGLKLGIQPMLFVDAYANYSSEGTFEDQPTKSRGRVDVEFKRFDWGPKIGLNYRFAGRFGLRLDYYHGLTNIMKDLVDFQRRNRQLGLGIECFFN
ncbi:MAG: PorT family protein [Saprospiraceae bacterium]|nr:PorT family protein [Saprospiraceae bacterium]